ncbi:hypothetical protein LAZ67_1001402 [Cordylochernes scorpioides]|uniref:Uncharacterized protein n=1 Tax=Cordylochernes scorpioides TaxID=51811 RepID=A0ABY6JWZ9_9ARAC|nr:hypothetical protein LAZ67_1001402 [Cordylochernes scorpioides]
MLCRFVKDIQHLRLGQLMTSKRQYGVYGEKKHNSRRNLDIESGRDANNCQPNCPIVLLFLATPSLRAPSRWRGVRVRDLAGPAPPPIARLTRSACEDAAALGAFCQRLVADNATSVYRERTLEEAVVLRGTATPFLRISTRTARRMLERPRLAAVPISRYFRRWAPVVDVPSTSLAFSSLRRCSFGGHAADIALRLALHALPHPGHPASSQPVCIACGSSDLSLAHRYWSCSAVRPLIREVFSIIGRPPDLQSWIFAVNLENHAITISSAAKHAIYVFFAHLDETWVHHYTPENKQQSKQWVEARGSASKKAKSSASARKILASVFWDDKGILLIDYLEKGRINTGEYYSNFLFQLDIKIREKRPGLRKNYCRRTTMVESVT